jgi:hypothetical protein
MSKGDAPPEEMEKMHGEPPDKQKVNSKPTSFIQSPGGQITPYYEN